MRAQRLLKEAPEVEGSAEDLGGGAHREQAVAVDDLETRVELVGCGRLHLGDEEARVVVAHDQRCAFGQRCQQSASSAELGLDVWKVDDVLVGEVPRVGTHPVQDELVEPVARPRVAEPQGLEHD